MSASGDVTEPSLDEAIRRESLQLASLLRELDRRIVFAESCTAGLVSASLAQVAGISEWLCGSAVTYRNATKAAWLSVGSKQLDDPGAVSRVVARQMASGVLANTAEADVSVSITGHLGPQAPVELDGQLHIAAALRDDAYREDTSDGVFSRSHLLAAGSRTSRQKQATLLVLQTASRVFETQRGWRQLQQPGCRAVCLSGADAENKSPQAVLAGSFDPFHPGHQAMMNTGRMKLGREVALEMSIGNVDKPDMNGAEALRRVFPLPPGTIIWLSRCPTFEEKSEVMSPTTFIVGADTMVRIADPKYYDGDPARQQGAFEAIAARGCGFLVLGRQIGDGFATLHDLDLPQSLKNICRGVSREEFSDSHSSTSIRDSQVTD